MSVAFRRLVVGDDVPYTRHLVSLRLWSILG